MSLCIRLLDGWYLSPVRDGDQSAFVEHLVDGDVSLAVPVIPYPYDISSADAWVQDRLRTQQELGVENCLAIRDPGGKLFGSVGVDDDQRGLSSRELGYWIGVSGRRHGLVSAAVAAFIPYAESILGAARLTAYAQIWNTASIRILERNGFARVQNILGSITTRTGTHETVGYCRDLNPMSGPTHACI